MCCSCLRLTVPEWQQWCIYHLTHQIPVKKASLHPPPVPNPRPPPTVLDTFTLLQPMSNVLRNSFLLQWHLHIIKIDRIIYTNTSVPALQMESSKYLPGLVALSGPTMGVLLPSPPTLLRMALLSRLWQETWQVRKSPHDTSNALLRVIWYKDLHVMIMSCIKSYKAVRVIWCVYISHINQYNYELYEVIQGVPCGHGLTLYQGR